MYNLYFSLCLGQLHKFPDLAFPLFLPGTSPFCKIQRKLKEREKLDLFDPLASIQKLQKITKGHQKPAKTKMPLEFRDTIKAPAAVVISLAIYR